MSNPDEGKGKKQNKDEVPFHWLWPFLFFLISLSRPFFRGGSNFSFSVAVPTPDLYKVLTEQSKTTATAGNQVFQKARIPNQHEYVCTCVCMYVCMYEETN